MHVFKIIESQYENVSKVILNHSTKADNHISTDDQNIDFRLMDKGKNWIVFGRKIDYRNDFQPTFLLFRMDNRACIIGTPSTFFLGALVILLIFFRTQVFSFIPMMILLAVMVINVVLIMIEMPRILRLIDAHLDY